MRRRPPLATVERPPLRPLDTTIRDIRIRRALRHVPVGAVVLDIGCDDGALFVAAGGSIQEGVGVDPTLRCSSEAGRVRFIADSFPTGELAASDGAFDAITLLAVLEHVPLERLPSWRDECTRLLKKGGVVVATVPSPRVDRILHVLMRMKLIAGMSLHEHHGLDQTRIPEIFTEGAFEEIARERFELGLNHLYAFRKRAA
jgi:2-polyprenyl-3-methyl-5-hydroxy-6-metoxy-1,4-benzoquinol methylase